MISTLFVMFFQAVAGDPAAIAPPPAPAPAVEPAPAPETPAEARRKAKEELVCHNERVVGSRMPVRICRSKSAADENTAASRAWLDRAQSQMPTHSN